MAFLIYTTWPDEKTASQAATTLLDEGLIACAHLAGAGTSFFNWQGKACTQDESVLWLKTPVRDTRRLKDRFTALHPYEIPAFIALSMDREMSHKAYLQWMRETIGKEV